ncbi:hypothetical protein A1O3_03797 [Capronia epimyces CBS 606.96]|uniref:USP domain-containing protein n=1 Tax=Capronia epimyces CBS 606.96 TaxID=1182542 RepID=W9Y2Z3_9EURO|nr:uncharacterized protein A1O3_03797 [Capronia epimyces CBS 606.96]EXJ86843.1 hypothetical protein A1O3_03797 [Capronia epimyces CBS 606.96]
MVSPRAAANNGANQPSNPTAPTTTAREISPATSTGPDFDLPAQIPDEATTAARNSMRRTLAPRGFTNPGDWVCYRNAVVVMLLSSKRILNWIQVRYIPRLIAAGVRIETQVEAKTVVDEDSDEEAAENAEGIPYTDVWCELSKLADVYWTDPETNALNNALKAFWNHFESKIKGRDTEWSAGSQQDATEFLGWLTDIAEDELGELCATLQQAGLLDEDQAKDLKSTTIDEMTSVSQTVRIRCNMCGILEGLPTMTRIATLNKMTVWPLAIGKLSASDNAEAKSPSPRAGRSSTRSTPTAQNTAPVALESLIYKDARGEQEGWLCELCRPYIIDQTHQNRLDATGDDAQAKAHAEQQNQAELDGLASHRTPVRRQICQLPEVLILSLTRFRHNPSRHRGEAYDKDTTKVKLGETLNLGPFLEHRGTAQPKGPTKYRLKAIVNHLGTRSVGHYTNQVFIDGRSFTINDTDVKPTSLKSTVNRQDKGWTPYVLLYEKIVDQKDWEERMWAQVGNDDDDDDDDDELVVDDGSFFEITTAENPAPGQMSMMISARVQGLKVEFPRFVLDDKLPTNTNTEDTTIALSKLDDGATVYIRREPAETSDSHTSVGAGAGADATTTGTGSNGGRRSRSGRGSSKSKSKTPPSNPIGGKRKRAPVDDTTTAAGDNEGRSPRPARGPSKSKSKSPGDGDDGDAPPAKQQRTVKTAATKKAAPKTAATKTAATKTAATKAAATKIAATKKAATKTAATKTAATKTAATKAAAAKTAATKTAARKQAAPRRRGAVSGRAGRGATRGSSKARTSSTSPFVYGGLQQRQRQARHADNAFDALLQRFVENEAARGPTTETARTPKSHAHNAKRSVTWAAQNDFASPLEWDSHTEEGSNYDDDEDLDEDLHLHAHAQTAPSEHRTREGVRVLEYRSLPAYVDSLMQMRMNSAGEEDETEDDITMDEETESETEADFDEVYLDAGFDE